MNSEPFYYYIKIISTKYKLRTYMNRMQENKFDNPMHLYQFP